MILGMVLARSAELRASNKPNNNLFWLNMFVYSSIAIDASSGDPAIFLSAKLTARTIAGSCA